MKIIALVGAWSFIGLYFGKVDLSTLSSGFAFGVTAVVVTCLLVIFSKKFGS